jgi:GNAT superfamily N-acetyltransferase
MERLLDNITWHSMTGPQARFAIGYGVARRYAPGFSPILAFSDATKPDFDAIAPFCESGERLYIGDWAGAAPADWQIHVDTIMLQMVWDACPPPNDEAPEAVPLGPSHVVKALELATLTNPGPFGPRTIELGEYFGLFDGPRLIAMAGERLHAGTLREVSGVCTHPDYQGRGYARRLMNKLIRRQIERGETPFLHVLIANLTARRLYERMGFRDRRECVIRVVTHSGAGSLKDHSHASSPP